MTEAVLRELLISVCEPASRPLRLSSMTLRGTNEQETSSTVLHNRHCMHNPVWHSPNSMSIMECEFKNAVNASSHTYLTFLMLPTSSLFIYDHDLSLKRVHVDHSIRTSALLVEALAKERQDARQALEDATVSHRHSAAEAAEEHQVRFDKALFEVS